MTAITNPFALLSDTSGRLIDGGYVHIGLPNIDPETNPAPVFWDRDRTIPAEQPLRTIAGYIARDGTPTKAYIDGAYSIRVRQANGAVVFTDLNALVSNPRGLVETLAELKAVPVEDKSAIYDGVLWTWTSGDYTGQADDVNIVKADGVALSAGAWLRQAADTLAFRQSGAGAVIRTAQAKARESVSVADYGAKGDGTTDDAGAINSAINAVAATGGVVTMDGLTYAVASPVLLKSKVTLRGKGAGKTVVKQIGTPAVWAAITTSTGIITTLNADNHADVHVEALSVVGLHAVPVADGAATYAKNGISLANCRDSSVRDCHVRDTGTGIVLFGVFPGVTQYRNTIAGCRVTNASSWIMAGNPGTPRGITMATAYSDVRDCMVEASHTGYYVATDYGAYHNCRVTGWSDDGFYVNASYCTFTACSAVIGTGSGFAINPSQGHRFVGCVAASCSNAGMRFRHAGQIAPSKNLVQGCRFENCGYGFLDDMIGADPYPAATAFGNTFADNIVIGCQQSGFKFIRQQIGVIASNTAIDNNQAGVIVQTRGGISLDGYCLDNRVVGNICYDTQGTPTQTFGLYSYPASASGATVENTGNRIDHRSKTGVDLFYAPSQLGVANITVASGARTATGHVDFPMRFEGTGEVFLTIRNGNLLADAEYPASATPYNMTATGFDFRVDLTAAAAAARALVVSWRAGFGGY